VKVSLRLAPRKFVQVDVLDSRCPLRPCFWSTEHMIRSAGAGASGTSSRSSGMLVCGHRDQTGCPQPIPEPLPKADAHYLRKDRAWQKSEPKG